MHIDRIAGFSCGFVPGSSPFQRLLDQGAHVNGWGRNIMQVHLSQSCTSRYDGRVNEVDEQF